MRIIYALFACLALSCGESNDHYTSYRAGPVTIDRADKGYTWRDSK